MKTIIAIAAIATAAATPAFAGSGWKVSNIIDGRVGPAALLAGTAVASDRTELPARLNISRQKNTTYFVVEPDRRSAKLGVWSDFAYHRQTTVRYKADNGAIEQGTWFATPNFEASAQ